MRLISYSPPTGGEALGVTAEDRWVAVSDLLLRGLGAMQDLIDGVFDGTGGPA